MPRSAIVFSCDEKFMPLAKGLVYSLRDLGLPNGTIDLVMIDIGLDEASLAFLDAHGVKVIGFDVSRHYDFDAGKQYHLAQLCRPVLPVILPGYDTYTWIDTDIWIQEGWVIEHHLELVRQFDQRAIISVCFDTSYDFYFAALDQIVSAVNRVYLTALDGDRDQARSFAFKPILSTGLFTMSAKSANWQAWKATVDRFFPKQYERMDDKHGIEQVALNYVVYRDSAYIPLDATYNYHCNDRMPLFDGSKVRVAMAPNRVIGAVHLSVAKTNLRHYLARKILYRQGTYLQPEEIDRLAGIDHYEIGV